MGTRDKMLAAAIMIALVGAGILLGTLWAAVMAPCGLLLVAAFLGRKAIKMYIMRRLHRRIRRSAPMAAIRGSDDAVRIRCYKCSAWIRLEATPESGEAFTCPDCGEKGTWLHPPRAK